MNKTEIYFQISDLPIFNKEDLRDFLVKMCEAENVKYIDFEPHMKIFKAVTNTEVTMTELAHITKSFANLLINNGFTIEAVKHGLYVETRIINGVNGELVSPYEENKLKNNPLYKLQSDFIGEWCFLN